MRKYKLVKPIIYLVGKIATKIGMTLERPIFIVSTGRCGSNLLANILKSHKKIAVYPYEANELWHPKTYPHNRAKVVTQPIIIDPKKYTETSIKNWPEGQEKVIQYMFKGFQFIKGRTKVFVTKSTMITFMIEDILNIYPKARFIHVYRNGVSVAASILEKEWHKYSSLINSKREFKVVCGRYWRSCIIEIERINKKLNLKSLNLLYEMSYEDLCKDPKSTLFELSKFIDCNLKEVKYDISRIKSTNYKVGEYVKNEKWSETLKEMYGAMKEKGYKT